MANVLEWLHTLLENPNFESSLVKIDQSTFIEEARKATLEHAVPK